MDECLTAKLENMSDIEVEDNSMKAEAFRITPLRKMKMMVLVQKSSILFVQKLKSLGFLAT